MGEPLPVHVARQYRLYLAAAQVVTRRTDGYLRDMDGAPGLRHQVELFLDRGRCSDPLDVRRAFGKPTAVVCVEQMHLTAHYIWYYCIYPD